MQINSYKEKHLFRPVVFLLLCLIYSLGFSHRKKRMKSKTGYFIYLISHYVIQVFRLQLLKTAFILLFAVTQRTFTIS